MLLVQERWGLFPWHQHCSFLDELQGFKVWLQYNQDNAVYLYLLIFLHCAVLNDVHPSWGVVPSHLLYPEEVLSPHPRHTYCCPAQQQHHPEPQQMHSEDKVLQPQVSPQLDWRGGRRVDFCSRIQRTVMTMKTDSADGWQAFISHSVWETLDPLWVFIPLGWLTAGQGRGVTDQQTRQANPNLSVWAEGQSCKSLTSKSKSSHQNGDSITDSGHKSHWHSESTSLDSSKVYIKLCVVCPVLAGISF